VEQVWVRYCIRRRIAYLDAMVRVRTRSTAARRKAVPQVPHELLVRLSRRRGHDPVVAFEWTDGAGELQFTVLSPAQSWPYLHRRN